MSALSTPPPLLPDRPLIVNWGLGKDSSAFLARVLTDPDACGIDLSRMVVLTLMPGSEWPDTLADAEKYILPLLRRRGVRYVQVARAGQSRLAGIDVLDDSRAPWIITGRGRWALEDELETNGTVPQQAGGRICSIRAKGEPGDDWIAGEFPGQPFTQVLGYHAGEQFRAERDRAADTNPLRTAWFPLIDWGWGDRGCEDFLYDLFGVRWKKSYCTFCCFPVSLGALPTHLDRMRRYPQIAARTLRLEYTSMRLNPHSRLFGRRSLLEQFRHDRSEDTAVLKAFAEELLACPWAVYWVRRILPAKAGAPDKRGPAMRSVQLLRHEEPGRIARVLRDLADKRHLPVEKDDPYGSVRVWLRTRGQSFPAVEELLVAAPASVRSK